MRYKYSRWDGAQRRAHLDAGELVHALADDLVAGGDLVHAIQRLAAHGTPPTSTTPVPGLQQLLQQIRHVRQRELERYNLESILDDICGQVAEIIAAEREALGALLAGPDGNAEQSKVLHSVVEPRQAVLDRLPVDAATAVAALQEHEFVSEDARARFEALEDRLRDHVLQRHVPSIQGSQRRVTEDGLGPFSAMVRDLNALLDEHARGGQPDFERFMDAHGGQFPGVNSLDTLVVGLVEQAAECAALHASMSAGVRLDVEAATDAVLPDPMLRAELSHLTNTLRTIAPLQTARYPFRGDVGLTLDETLALMHRLGDLDRLEASMVRVQESGDLDSLDLDLVRRALGNEAARSVEDLQRLTDVLEEAGYAHRTEDGLQLTTRGVRKIGEKALQDIFSHLRVDAFGEHGIERMGSGFDRAQETKPYEYGDAFLLDLNRTLMNGVARGGPGLPVRLQASDVEVYSTEHRTQCATVLMLDMSRSMPLRGCLVAAKRVALALQSLILTQFPRDRLHVLTFSEFAREIEPEALPQLTWGDNVYGTNMQHGFMLARRLLGRHTTGTKQIILITDGEPTAHCEENRVHFAYPPTRRTFRETLREVARCTRDGIVINTFMLERSQYLTDFVNQMTKINHGRAFFATPERLGDYIVVDYVGSKVKRSAAIP